MKRIRSLIIVMFIISLMLTSYFIIQEIQVSNKWEGVNDWGYQLQNIDIEEIRATKFDLLDTRTSWFLAILILVRGRLVPTVSGFTSPSGCT